MESNDNLWQEMQTQETRCDLRQGKDLGLVKNGEIHRGKVVFNNAHGFSLGKSEVLSMYNQVPVCVAVVDSMGI